MGVIVRTLSASAVSVRKWAERLGKSVILARGGVKVGLLNGYMARAVGNANTAIVTVIDPPGVVMIPDPLNVADGDAYTIGDRDQFDSMLMKPITPLVRSDIPVAFKPVTPAALGFAADAAEWLASEYWPSHRGSVRQSDRLYASRLRIAPGAPGFPYSSTDQVGVTDTVFAGVDVFPVSKGAPSYYLSESAVDEMAPGYQLAARTDLGYMAWEYQTLPPVAARIGSVSLMVCPVVQNIDPTEAVHWGYSGVLFVLLDSSRIDTPGGPIVASHLWTPNAHGSTFFHNGAWIKRPSGIVNSPYSAPKASWDAFWTTPDISGGSRPNWTDAVSVAAFNGRFVVSLRLCALNGAVDGPTGIYTMSGGSGVMRFDVSTAGVVAPTQQAHEVWSFSRGDSNDAPYNTWVADVLDAAVIRAVNPMALMATAADLIDVRLCVDASRSDFTAIVGGLHAQARPTADLNTARLEVSITRLDESGAELPPVIHTVSFSTLGAGMSCPLVYQAGKYQLIAPTQSYKLWPANNQFVRISDTELAFIVRDNWQAISPSENSPVSLAVLDITTGATTIRGSIEVSTAENISYARSEHLCCIQKTVRADDGGIVTEGVLLFSSRTENAVRISRDSGVTWQDYIEFPRPQSGAYYIGSALMAGMQPGRFIR